MITAGTVPVLLARLLADDPGRPRVTWYGAGGERVEFSAKVLGNWVAKTSNLMVEELDVEPGTVVHLVLPIHWRTAVWLLSTWSVGAHAIVHDDAGEFGTVILGPDDLVISHLVPVLEAASAAGARAVGVALPSLATAFGPGLPDGAVDSGVEVRLQGDAFVPLTPPTPDDVALTVPGHGDPVTYGGLLDAARAVAQADLPSPEVPGEPRVLTGAAPVDVVASWLAPLVAGGSLILHHDLDSLDPETLTRLRMQEGVSGGL